MEKAEPQHRSAKDQRRGANLYPKQSTVSGWSFFLFFTQKHKKKLKITKKNNKKTKQLKSMMGCLLSST